MNNVVSEPDERFQCMGNPRYEECEKCEKYSNCLFNRFTEAKNYLAKISIE